ncbi:hypothetical protein [Hyphomicrobium sp. CS1BSMeth3]|uniref:hypothetical protein n=1 Tax=Hyphomicrobium sp. CS1BSMeth3 TaxID=1892844 RepID=UPI0009300A7F|nr:hypothetical protein [Hyphomicrobium sp. CS1BSMeth3]
MIITHAVDPHGNSRIYLGGKASIECWIEPSQEDASWTFHMQEGLSGTHLDHHQKHQWAIHILKALADEIGVAPSDLKGVPYHAIMNHHTPDPFDGRRAPAPRKQSYDTAYVATPPHRPPPRKDQPKSPHAILRSRAR